MSSSRSPVNNAAELSAAIAGLELKADLQKKEMMLAFEGVKESFKPMNLLKQTVHSTFSPDKKADIVGTALGLGSGLLGRKLLFGSSSGILGKLLGAAVEFGLGGLVAKNADRIKEKGSEWLDKFMPSKRTSPSRRTIRTPGLKTDPGGLAKIPTPNRQLKPDPEAGGSNFYPKS